MQENKVKIADGSPETRARLDNFKSKMKLGRPLDKITMGDAIDFAIAQAERVPELEEENRKLNERIRELEEEVDTLNAATSDMSLQLMKGE